MGMSSSMNQHCANCISTLLFPIDADCSTNHAIIYLTFVVVHCRMELCHVSEVQLRSRLINSSDHLELITPACDIYHLKPYKIYGMQSSCVINMYCVFLFIVYCSMQLGQLMVNLDMDG